MKDQAAPLMPALSRLFSSGVIRELARMGRSPLFARLASQYELIATLGVSGPVYNLFEAAFRLLKQQGHRDEYIYKAALVHKILLGRYSLQTASMLNEFRVGACKADLAILNGTATVYEVKSERDSLVRLKRQIAAYLTVFARVYVIAAESHVDAVLACLDDDVGVLGLTNRHQISTIREATDRPERTSPEAIFNSIRTLEARLILEEVGTPIPNVPNTQRSCEYRKLFVELHPAVAHKGMVRVLKKTRNLMRLADLVENLPVSLQTAALSVPIRRIDHDRLLGAINTPLEEALSWG